MLKLTRNLTILGAIFASAIAMSGCVIIKSQSAAQLNSIGAVQITTTACASDQSADNSGYSSPDATCQASDSGGNSGGEAVDSQAQLLLAYRIPAVASSPDTITTTDPDSGSAITFNRDPGYTSELQNLSHAPAGEQWVGYLSDVVDYATAGPQYFTVAPRFSLQRGADGVPFGGPFRYRVLVGFRGVDSGDPADRPVSCNGSLTNFHSSDKSICADDPSPATLATDQQLATADLGILDAPGTESVSQGDVIQVKFLADYAGDGNPAPGFHLGASTDIPGATAAPSAPALTPNEGDNPLRAVVRVPVDTPPGHYDVTLTATLPNGETRSSTHDVLVTPTTTRCDGIAPTIAGTPGNDVLTGTRGPDVIAGFGGNDKIKGLSGNDIICAGPGNDTVRGGPGNDTISGRGGNDLLIGGHGHDVMNGGPGRDRLKH